MTYKFACVLICNFFLLFGYLIPAIFLLGLPKADLQLHIKSLTGDQRTVDRPVRIGYENLDAETSLYWRCLGEHLRSQGVDGEELLDELLPEMSGFCDYIQGYKTNAVASYALYEIPVARDVQLLKKLFAALFRSQSEPLNVTYQVKLASVKRFRD